MQTLTLKVQDHAVAKVMQLLSTLPEQEVKILNESLLPTQGLETPPKSMADLYGVLSPYVSGKLSDEDIEKAIVEGAYESGMAGLNDG